VRLRYIFTEKKSGKLENLKIPKVENAIFKVYCKQGTDISRLYEIYKLPLVKLIGYIVWGKSKREVEEREREILNKLKVKVR